MSEAVLGSMVIATTLPRVPPLAVSYPFLNDTGEGTLSRVCCASRPYSRVPPTAAVPLLTNYTAQSNDLGMSTKFYYTSQLGGGRATDSEVHG